MQNKNSNKKILNEEKEKNGILRSLKEKFPHLDLELHQWGKLMAINIINFAGVDINIRELRKYIINALRKDSTEDLILFLKSYGIEKTIIFSDRNPKICS